MKLPHRRQFLHLAAGAAALRSWPRIAAAADAYPSRTMLKLSLSKNVALTVLLEVTASSV